MINAPFKPAELPRRSVVADEIPQRSRASHPPLILLFTRDRAFHEVVAEALLGRSAIVLIARTVADALRLVCQRGAELDLVVMDFDDGCRGMTLLSAVHTCYEQLPVLITAARDEAHVQQVAYAHGARACLEKPFATETLSNVIASLRDSPERLMAA